MKFILFHKKGKIFIITKSLNQYPNVNAQTSDEIQPLENNENSIVVFDDELLSKQESNINIRLMQTTASRRTQHVVPQG